MIFEVASLTHTFLIAIRIGTVILFSPIEAIRLLPIHMRILIVLMLSVLIVANLNFTNTQINDAQLLVAGIFEFCNGLILSCSLYAAFGIFHIAGHLIDTQMGLNGVAIFNPCDHVSDPLSSRLLMMLAVLFFLAINGHHYLIRALSTSFKIIAPGQSLLFNGYMPIIHQFSDMFLLAIMLASPVVASLLVIDIIGAILTRNMPQISTYFLILPIKIILGLFMCGLLLSYVNPFMQKVFGMYFNFLDAILHE